MTMSIASTRRPYSTPHPFTTGEDISSDEFWRKSPAERDETFARLRKKAPVSWHPPRPVPWLPAEYLNAGFWAIVKHADIRFVNQNHTLFSSDFRKGGVGFPSAPPNWLLAPNFLHMDPPDHTRHRQMMNAAFTPKAVAKLNEKIVERAEQIIGRVVGAGEFDLVKEVSSRLPMLTVADLIGVPESLIDEFTHAGNMLASIQDPEVVPAGMTGMEFRLAQLDTLKRIGVELVTYRRKHPADDIATALAMAEFDGKRLSDDEVGSYMQVLSLAGNDTTKQTTTFTVMAFDDNPEQRDWLMEDFAGRIGQSVEEFVRFASPLIAFARSAQEDIELGGQKISAHDKVVMFLASGNRDEDVWKDAGRFDLSRERKPHVGFGGGGVHFCLGAGVAKAQLKALFSEILSKLPNLRVVGEPDYLFSDVFNGVKRLQVTV